MQLLKHSFMHNKFQNELDNSTARMWQMYVGIVGVNCNAWVEFTTGCNLSLDKFEHPLTCFYYLQCLLEGIDEVKILTLFHLPSKTVL